MTWILWLLAAVCVIYYAVIVIYSGFTTSFSFIWMIFAAVCLLLALAWEYYMKHKDRTPLWIPVSIGTFCCTGILIFAVVEMLIFAGVGGQNHANLDYVIVLGARVKEEGVSKSLRERLDKALGYLKENPGTKLVLSGGRGKDEPVSEAAAMRDYLINHGVDERRLILEPQSFSTVENITYSRAAIEKDVAKRKARRGKSGVVMEPGTYENIPDKPIRIGVLTSDYHVFRAEQIAKKWGIPDICGISGESDPVMLAHFCVRECAAILKDKMLGNM